MIINILGDSITQGAGASSPDLNFVELLQKRFPNDVICNYGLGGTRIARQELFYEPKTYKIESYMKAFYNLDFNARALTMRKDADYVFVFGGTNDFGHGSAPLGKEEDNTPYTFYGALNCLFEYLQKTYGKGKVITILPLPRFDEDSKHGSWYCTFEKECPNLYEYREVIKNRCEKFGIRCLDFGKYFPRILEEKNEGMFFDGLHPNDKGHKKLADLLEKEINSLKINNSFRKDLKKY